MVAIVVSLTLAYCLVLEQLVGSCLVLDFSPAVPRRGAPVAPRTSEPRHVVATQGPLRRGQTVHRAWETETGPEYGLEGRTRSTQPRQCLLHSRWMNWATGPPRSRPNHGSLRDLACPGPPEPCAEVPAQRAGATCGDRTSRCGGLPNPPLSWRAAQPQKWHASEPHRGCLLVQSRASSATAPHRPLSNRGLASPPQQGQRSH